MAEPHGTEFVLPELPPAEPAGPPASPVAEAPPRIPRERPARWDPAARPPLLRALDLPLRWGPAALLALAPLAWGSVEGWSGAAVTVGAASIAAIWLAKLLLFPAPCREERAATGHLRSWSAGLHGPLAALAAVGLLQLAPLGPLLGAISPASAEGYRLAGVTGAARVTLAPGGTLRSLADLAALALLFLAVLDTLRGRRDARFLAAAVVVAGFAHAVGAILWHFAASGRAYWSPAAGGIAFGPYFNRNHFACLMGMAIPVGIGYLLSLGHRRGLPGAAGAAAPGRGSRGEGEPRQRQVLAGFAVAVMAGALCLSLSRAGIASTLVALAALCLALGIGSRTRGRLLAVAGTVAAAASFGAWLAAGALSERLSSLGDLGRDGSASGRLAIWGDTLRMAAEFPLLGSGFGSYGAVLPRYRAAQAALSVEHAHNDWLQLLAEGGVAAALAAAALVAAYVGAAARILRRRRDREAIFLAAGCLAGLLAFLLHSLADFNLHIPANALWFAVLAAAGLKAAASRA